MKAKPLAIAITIIVLTLAFLIFGLSRSERKPTESSLSKIDQPSGIPRETTDVAPPIQTRRLANPASGQSPDDERPGQTRGKSTASKSQESSRANPQTIHRASTGITSPAESVALAPARISPEPSTAIGIRLAPDVRLPVAAMPNDLQLSPVAQKALQHIIDEYYQTVAASAAAQNPEGDPDSLLETSENGELTRVITNNPQVDAARKRADLLFKALFGKAAYNRLTMNTLLESRLPELHTE